MQIMKKILSGVIGAVVGIIVLVLLRQTVFVDPPSTPSNPKPTITVANKDKTPAYSQKNVTPIEVTSFPLLKKTNRNISKNHIISESQPVTVSVTLPVPTRKPAIATSKPAIPVTNSRVAASRPAVAASQPTLLTTAKAAEQDGNLALAIELYKRIATKNPNDTEVLHRLASALLASEQFDETIPVYKQILKISPSKITAHNLAIAYMRTRQFREAELLYIDLIKRNPEYLPARENLGKIYYQEGKLEQAKELFTVIASQHKDHYEAYIFLGEIQIKTKQYKKAIEHYSKAMQIKPDMAPPRLYIASAAIRMGSYGRAAMSLKQAAGRKGLMPEEYDLLGDNFLLVFRKINKKPLLLSAIKAWKKASELVTDKEELIKKIKQYEEMSKLMDNPPG